MTGPGKFVVIVKFSTAASMPPSQVLSLDQYELKEYDVHKSEVKLSEDNRKFLLHKAEEG